MVLKKITLVESRIIGDQDLKQEQLEEICQWLGLGC